MKKERVLVAMSGGVDSSVAAALLVRQGYDVTGMFAVNYQASLSELRLTSSESEFTGSVSATLRRINTLEDNKEFTGRSVAEPCWLPDYRDAVRVAAKLGIKLIKLDFRKEYKKLVLDYMFREYRAGRTPNPDVMCNKFVKFGVWLDRAKKLGFDNFATGHYACVKETRNKKQTNQKYPISNIQYHLTQAKDNNKDQTYFLHQLNQKQLSHILFPLGDYLKSEVRKLAKKFNLPTADKEESMGICFVGEVPMKEFLQTRIKTKPGRIVFSDGVVVGVHIGLPFYTIGQRTGLEIRNCLRPELRPRGKLEIREKQNTEPIFVVGKDIRNNKLIVGFQDDPLLYKKEIKVSGVNWISGHSPKFPLKCKVRLRHRQPLQKSKIINHKSKMIAQFEKSQRAVTPGQFAVFYLKGECLGGGVIV